MKTWSIFVPRLPDGHPYAGILDMRPALPPPPPSRRQPDPEEVATINLTGEELEELEWASRRLAAIDTYGS